MENREKVVVRFNKGKILKGFYLIPTDGGSNNIKVFVVGSSIKDMTIMP